MESISVSGGHLAAYSIGEGPSVIFLHGGPGDTHDYMRRMAEPLLPNFRCIFFDQRGTGGSKDFERTPEQFTLENLFNDLRSVQERFHASDAMLVGHSWGAMYALYACIRYPGFFKKAALLSIGPLDAAMEKATSEYLISVLSDSEKLEWKNLRIERNKARDNRNVVRVEALDKDLMRLRVKAWIFNPNLREKFLSEYFQDPPPDREINKLIWDGRQEWFSWNRLSEIKNPIWLCVGANDSVPVTQAEQICEMTSDTHLSVFESCGHLPWLEYSEKFYPQLCRFLQRRLD